MIVPSDRLQQLSDFEAALSRKIPTHMAIGGNLETPDMEMRPVLLATLVVLVAMNIMWLLSDFWGRGRRNNGALEEPPSCLARKIVHLTEALYLPVICTSCWHAQL
jgi:hypothetical protein